MAATGETPAAGAAAPPPPALLSRLNPEQLAVAQFDTNRPLLVLACAGTGKTTTLMARVGEMLRQVGTPRHAVQQRGWNATPPCTLWHPLAPVGTPGT